MLMTLVLGKLLVGCVVILEMRWFCADSCCWWCVCETAKYLKLLRITFVTAVTGISKYRRRIQNTEELNILLQFLEHSHADNLS